MVELRDCRVTIVGLGLMGGSLALALRPHVAGLAAVETSPAGFALARSLDIVDVVHSDLAAGVAGADLVVLATPVRTILALLEQLPHARPGGCLVLDLGSTKQAVCRAMAALPAGFRAIGGHPMCGKESAGLAAATADLYQGQTFVLCPPLGLPDPAWAVLAEALVTQIGSRPVWLPPDSHDQLVALTSHLPYVAAALLMQQAAQAASGNGHVWPVSASGFRDTARLAGSDPAMLRDILLTNRAAVLARLQQYQTGLAQFIQLLDSADEAALYQWLAARQAEHDLYRQAKLEPPALPTTGEDDVYANYGSG